MKLQMILKYEQHLHLIYQSLITNAQNSSIKRIDIVHSMFKQCERLNSLLELTLLSNYLYLNNFEKTLSWIMSIISTVLFAFFWTLSGAIILIISADTSRLTPML